MRLAAHARLTTSMRFPHSLALCSLIRAHYGVSVSRTRRKSVELLGKDSR